MTANPSSKLWGAAGSLENADGKTAFDARLLGDKAASDVIDRYIEYLAVSITNYINIFQPERLSIGGGVSAQGDVLLIPLKERVRKMVYTKDSARNTEIVISSLGNDAAVIGSAMLYKLA